MEELLIQSSQDSDPRVRWLSVAALRKRTSPAVLSRLRETLKDPDERVRLNALYALFPYREKPPFAAAVKALRSDKHPLVRTAWCFLSLTHDLPREEHLVVCLREREPRPRMAIARAILASPKASQSLKIRAKAALQDGKMRRSWMTHHFFFRRSLVQGARLRIYLRNQRAYVQRVYNNVEKWHKRYRDLKGTDVACLKRSLGLIRRQQVKIADLQYKILAAYAQKNMQALDWHHSAFRLARNLAVRIYYPSASRCFRRLNKRFASHHQLLRGGVWFDDFPIFYDHPSLRRFEASANFLFDSFVDQLRDDFHASYEPESKINKRIWTLATGLDARVVYQWNWRNGWLLRMDGSAEGRYFFLAPHLGIFGGRLDIQLMHAEQKLANERLIFLRLFGEYSQAPPEETGWPEWFAGERVRSHVSFGIAKRWGNLSRGISARFLVEHDLQAPIKQLEDVPLSAGMRSRLQAIAAVRGRWGLFRLGLWQRFSWSHAFEQGNLSANHWDVLLRLFIGKRRRDLNFELSGGLGAYWPLPTSSQPLWPSLLTQPLYTPILSISLSSPINIRRFFLHWLLRFERKLYPSLRFDASATIEHRFLAQVSFGAPPPQFSQLPWKEFVILFGLSLHFLEIDALRPQTQGASIAAKIPQQLIRIFMKSYVPFQRHWGIEVGLNLDFATQGFRSYEEIDSDPIQAVARTNFLPRVMTYLRIRFGLPLRR
ncbi:MAG: HEAT repeat domain-containing protein [Myxococcales bacterium]|nr:HEAT repeat domain-containing protein [Myxococcales bacterium]